jgi:hypothetical protein
MIGADGQHHDYCPDGCPVAKLSIRKVHMDIKVTPEIPLICYPSSSWATAGRHSVRTYLLSGTGSQSLLQERMDELVRTTDTTEQNPVGGIVEEPDAAPRKIPGSQKHDPQGQMLQTSDAAVIQAHGHPGHHAGGQATRRSKEYPNE